MKITTYPIVGLLWSGFLFAQSTIAPLRTEVGSVGQSSLHTRASDGPNYDVSIYTDYGARLLLTDDQGHQCSFAMDEESTCAQIPTATYGDNSLSDPSDDAGDNPAGIEQRELVLAPPAQGRYRLEVLPNNRESYWIELRCQGDGYDNFHQFANETMKVDILPNEHHRYRFVVGPECPADFAQGALGKTGEAESPPLSYAFPASFHLKIERGQRFHFVVVYGAEINPSKFAAELNGVSVANLFHPKPATIESVEISLQPGTNIVRISAASGKQTCHTDTFTIEVAPQD